MIFVTEKMGPYKLTDSDIRLIKITKPNHTSLDSWVKIAGPEIAKARIEHSIERHG